MASIFTRATKAGETRFVVQYRTVDMKQRKRTFNRRAEAEQFADLIEAERTKAKTSSRIESAVQELGCACGCELTEEQRTRIAEILQAG